MAEALEKNIFYIIFKIYGLVDKIAKKLVCEAKDALILTNFFCISEIKELKDITNLFF